MADRFFISLVLFHMLLQSVVSHAPASTYAAWCIPASLLLMRPDSVSQSSAMKKWPLEFSHGHAARLLMWSASCRLDISDRVCLYLSLYPSFTSV